MGSIQVQKENGKPREGQIAPAQPPSRWEPFRMLRDLVSWDPFREMQPLISGAPGGFMPSFDVKETKDAYLFKADVPGLKENDLEVNLSGNRLTISGKREAEREEKSEQYYCYERSYGDFARSFTLPDGVDASRIQADLKDGVLSIQVPKMPQAQSKKIAVQTGKS